MSDLRPLTVSTHGATLMDQGPTIPTHDLGPTHEEASDVTIESTTDVTEMISENSRATRDALSTKRVFGEPYSAGGRTIIPVAAVSGGAGGGGGEGSKEGEAGNGAGSGFGLTARPVGVYVVDDDGVEWRPSVDVTRLARGGQVLAGIVAVCLTIVYWRRSG